jgi:hypothetical protein
MSAAWYVAALLIALVSGLLARLLRRRFSLAGWMQDAALSAPGVAAGCALGRWLGLPEPAQVSIDGEPLPLLWGALGALLCLVSQAWLARNSVARASGRPRLARRAG